MSPRHWGPYRASDNGGVPCNRPRLRSQRPRPPSRSPRANAGWSIPDSPNTIRVRSRNERWLTSSTRGGGWRCSMRGSTSSTPSTAFLQKRRRWRRVASGSRQRRRLGRSGSVPRRRSGLLDGRRGRLCDRRPRHRRSRGVGPDRRPAASTPAASPRPSERSRSAAVLAENAMTGHPGR